MKKIILLLILLLPAIWFLLKPGFFPSDDGEWMVVRLSDFHRSVVSGQIPVRWAARLNFSYGYPVFDFLYPLSLYVGELLHLIGFSFVWSVKLVFIFSFILSAFFMYLWRKKIVSAIFYAYAPYRFLDVYVRGSIGEAIGFVFLPLVFWSIQKLSEKFQKKYLVIGSLAYAALIMSHNIMAMIFTPIILAYIIWLFLPKKDKKFLYSCLLLLAFALAVSCFFWLPAIYDSRFVIFNQVSVTNPLEHFPSIRQLLIPSWGYGPSVVGFNDQASYQIGLLHLAIVATAFLVIDWGISFFVLVFLAAVFLMLPVSGDLWKKLPFLNLVQFPWRLLAITAFSSSVLAGEVTRRVKPNLKRYLELSLLILVIALNFRYARPETVVSRGDGFYATNEATTTVKDEYMPIWVRKKPTARPDQKVEIISGTGVIENLKFNSRMVSFTTKSENGTVLQVNTVYFPGWQAIVDGQNQPIDYQNNKGLILLTVPSGMHLVLVEFKETAIRLLADIVSVFGLLGLIIVLRKR